MHSAEKHLVLAKAEMLRYSAAAGCTALLGETLRHAMVLAALGLDNARGKLR